MIGIVFVLLIQLVLLVSVLSSLVISLVVLCVGVVIVIVSVHDFGSVIASDIVMFVIGIVL